MKGRNRCTLLIHPEDAQKRGIDDRQTIKIMSRVGELQVAVELTDKMMPGVVCLPHGYGHHRGHTNAHCAGTPRCKCQ
ncbi:MAG: molybdopterin dinucleotide binding domain-containing protein [Spirosomataceae bacterium]